MYSLKETLRDQCTPTQKVMLLLFIINPSIQENTNNVVKGTSNEAFCLFKIGFDYIIVKVAVHRLLTGIGYEYWHTKLLTTETNY